MLRSIRPTRRYNLGLQNFCRSSECSSWLYRWHFSTSTPTSRKAPTPQHQLQKLRWTYYSVSLVAVAGIGTIAYNFSDPFRYTCLAVIRCSRVARAVILDAVDYKITLSKTYISDEERFQSYSHCHTRSARRVLKALLANGGIFIKLGQHISSLVVLPKEWTSTMRPLQDQCEPTPQEYVEALFLSDIGQPVSALFDEFNDKPLGVASLAQVHMARLKDSGQLVAVKLQHPHLAEFCDIDMKTVEVALGWIKTWFPEFEFTWLGEEMRKNLPKEMDFIHEASNAERAIQDFRNIRTSLYIPEVILASKRVLIMEFIEGGRVDDLEYLAEHKIDRNKVALEIQRIFCQMVHINGWIHADPHPGNILIRPSPFHSRSPYNFEVVLLDHGLYFDIDDDLRINYSKLWLSLITSASPEVNAKRRKYAELVGNIGPDLYPIFESAITGRVGLEGAHDDNKEHKIKRPSSMVEMLPQTEEEMELIRNAVIQREGLILSVLDILRRVPRRVLMVLKLNDLTRNLDHSLMTTHSTIRIFLITGRYCSKAVWQDNRRRLMEEMKEKGLMSYPLLSAYVKRWWSYKKLYDGLRIVEWYMDAAAWYVKTGAWLRGLLTRGFYGAHLAASGLA